jgi:hypothetical protein
VRKEVREIMKIRIVTLICVMVIGLIGCSSNEPLKNYGDLSVYQPCMDKAGIDYEKRADGFYMSESDWGDKFIMYCS